MRPGSKTLKPQNINLVSARSRSNPEVNRYSRTASEDNYSKQRRKRANRKRVLAGFSIGLAAILVAVAAGVAGFIFYLNMELHKPPSGVGTIDLGSINDVLYDRAKPEDPFYLLLMGTDDRPDDLPRTDTLILARIDPGNRTAVLVSIPRDTYVADIGGWGPQKINAAYAIGEYLHEDGEEDMNGPRLCIETVSKFAGVELAGFIQVNFDGFRDVVNSLGGVWVDVPVEIIGDDEAGGLDIYEGYQLLNGDQALVFCRSRKVFDLGDYQRQANQRTFLQALAKQVLAADPVTIAGSVTTMAQISFTNFDALELVSIASSMQGLQESDIHTYTVPSYGETKDEISYEMTYTAQWQQLMAAIDAGELPDVDDVQAGVIPDSYKPKQRAVTDNIGADAAAAVTTGDYLVAVRNGWGIAGAATAVSDMLALAGYRQGEIGNTNASVYDETLIVYNKDAVEAAANDIRTRLGYGRVIFSESYSFEGDVLVVVGGDFKGSAL